MDCRFWESVGRQASWMRVLELCGFRPLAFEADRVWGVRTVRSSRDLGLRGLDMGGGGGLDVASGV